MVLVSNPTHQPRWRRRPDRRSDEILDATLRVFARDGLHKTNLEEVAKEVGISKGTIYLYFKDKATEGKTLFVTTHYLDEMEHAHHIGFIDRGKLIGFDSPLGLKVNFAGGYRVRLLHDEPHLILFGLAITNEVNHAAWIVYD